MSNKMCSDFHRNILKNVEDFTKSIRGLVRTFGQCTFNDLCTHCTLYIDQELRKKCI